MRKFKFYYNPSGELIGEIAGFSVREARRAFKQTYPMYADVMIDVETRDE